MKTTSHSKAGIRIESLEMQRILTYENADVVDRISREGGFSAEKAQTVFKDTLRFLFLCGTSTGSWSPSRTIDVGWHAFLMYTEDYAEFCDTYFGRFIHHRPTRIGERPSSQKSKSTLIAAMQVFGKENLSENWVYRDQNGNAVFGPSLTVSELSAAEVADSPCDSCGCSACDG